MSILTWEAVAEPTDRFPSCHCSVLMERYDGELLVGYYAGEGEAKTDARGAGATTAGRGDEQNEEGDEAPAWEI